MENSWQGIPDLRSSFKVDIVRNLKKLTCDFERSIFIHDIEESAIIYALDMCLEWHNKSGYVNHTIIYDITNQVCDVYMELFDDEFCQPNKEHCIECVLTLYNSQGVRNRVDSYYRRINDRYYR